MTIYDLKPAFQNLLRPITKGLAKRGVTANQVTLFACGMSILVGAMVSAWSWDPCAYLLLPAVLFLRMALNAIDGMLAREHGQKSRLGALLNELTDVLSDAALYLPFALLTDTEPALVVWVVMLATLTEMTGVVASTIGASRRYDGPFGKSDRAFAFGLIALLVGIGVPVQPWLNYVWAAMIVLLVVTIVNRGRRALEQGAERV